MTDAQWLNSALLAVLKHRADPQQDRHRPGWHLSPPAGLLNDPNGFIQINGVWHLFYQWNPLACAHGAKCWGHWCSQNLVDWTQQPVALVPSGEYESHGCYSGSAIEHQGELILFYTGNVKMEHSRTAWQCMATVSENGDVLKTGPVFALPEGYSGHVRDPKVWQHGDRWYMVLGAQNLAGEGKILLCHSTTLTEWQLLGEIAGSHLNGLGDFGYMWECPDLFPLGGKDILLTCPQGLAAKEKAWLNTFQSGYFIGELDYQAVTYRHGEFYELDQGFEFYAPQTTLSQDGRRLMFGWMGLPDENEFYQPTLAQGWIHIMTCPRELTLEQGKLMQRPARELQRLRKMHTHLENVAGLLPELDVSQAEIAINVGGNWSASFANVMRLECDEEGLTLSRVNLRSGEEEKRYWRGRVNHVQMLCDRSSVEIFINQGEGVMSGRYFPQSTPTLSWQGKGPLKVDYWQLESAMID